MNREHRAGALWGDPRRWPLAAGRIVTALIVEALIATGLIISAPGAVGTARAGSGDLVGRSDVLAGADLADICQDTSDGSFWIVGANGVSSESHQIHHVSADLEAVLGAIDNPHPPGSIATNDLTTNRGIAFRPLSGTIFVLSSVGPRGGQTYQVREVTVEGVPVDGSAFTVSPPGATASLFGLSYDVLSRQFWTLDTQNDRAIRFTASGDVTEDFALPGKSSPFVVLRGRGIAADLDGVESVIHVTWGDVFRTGPSTLIQLAGAGVDGGEGDSVAAPTGVEVPLLDLPDQEFRGVEVYRGGPGASQRRAVLVGVDGTLYEVERSASDPLPPSGLTCSITLSNQVLVSWTSHGGMPDDAYGGTVQIRRNGIPFATLLGDATEFLDQAPTDGASTYSVRGSREDRTFSDWSSPCEVTVGTGGLVAWAPFPGVSPFDLTESPETGEVFVTDDLLGKVFRLGADLELLGEVPSPWPDPGPIAFLPSIQLGFPPVEFQNLLAVGEASGSRVRFVDPEDPEGVVITTITVRHSDVEEPSPGGLTWDPGRKLFHLIERTNDSVYTFSSSGTQVARCEPPDILISDPPDRGITYDPLMDAFLVAFEGGTVYELLGETACAPSGFEIPLERLGPRHGEPGMVGGIQISDNTLLACARGLNAIVRLLVFPFSPDFIRGDVDQNEAVNITDAVSIARYLFVRGDAPSCNDAADVNDDGALDVSDPVYLLFWLFVAESPPPPAPYPELGTDPTFRDHLGCAQ